MSVFDEERVVRAQRAVSLRELSRKAGQLVDHVHRTGEVVLVGRYGQIAAALVPVPERMVLELQGTGLGDAAYEELPTTEIRPEWADLDEVSRLVLARALDAHPMPFGLEDLPFAAAKTGAAVGGLELDGLIERDWSGNRLTSEGLAAARWLRDSLADQSAVPATLVEVRDVGSADLEAQ